MRSVISLSRPSAPNEMTDPLRRPGRRGRGPGDRGAWRPTGRIDSSFEGTPSRAERSVPRQATALPGATRPHRRSRCGRRASRDARTPSSARGPSPSEVPRPPGSGARRVGVGRDDPRRGSRTTTTCRTRSHRRRGSPPAPCSQGRGAPARGEIAGLVSTRKKVGGSGLQPSRGCSSLVQRLGRGRGEPCAGHAQVPSAPP